MIPAVTKALIFKDLKQEHSIAQVCRDHKVSRPTVRSIRDGAGLKKLPISQKVEEQILVDLQQGASIIYVRRKYNITQYRAEKIRNGKSFRYQQEELIKASIRVPKFRCPLCGTINIRKAECDDKICLACVTRMKKK